MKTNQNSAFKILVGITSLFLLFHFLILFKVIPYSITWGGRLKNDEEMYVMEVVSILVNSFYIYVLLQKGKFIKSLFSEKVLSIILWIFFAIFSLNTVGNIVAVTLLERAFTLVTLLNAILIWIVNRKEKANNLKYNKLSDSAQ